MKKSITGTVALLAGVFVACSQGTVFFGDLYSVPNYITVEYKGQPVGGTAPHTGTPADIHAGSDWTVELYGMAGANQPLSALVPAVLDGTVSTPVTATLAGGGVGAYLGTWLSSEVGDLSGTTFARQPATVAVAAWYNNGGTLTTIAAAQALGYPNAFSATGNVNTGGPFQGGGGGDVAASLPQLGNGIIDTGVVPEPSTIALGVMGASSFLMRLRRKQ